MHKQEAERTGSGPCPTSVSKVCLLKVLEASQTAPSAGDQVFKYMSLSRVTFLFQTLTLLLSSPPTKDQSELESGSLFPQ